MFQTIVEGALEVQLEHSESSTDTGCPLFIPRPGIDCLHRHAERAVKDVERLGTGRNIMFTSCMLSITNMLPSLWRNILKTKKNKKTVSIINCKLVLLKTRNVGLPRVTRKLYSNNIHIWMTDLQYGCGGSPHVSYVLVEKWVAHTILDITKAMRDHEN